MNKLQACGVLAAFAFAGAAFAQNPPTRPDDPSQPSTTTPSTSPTEGTAADRTAPGRTPTQQQPATADSQHSEHAQPSTSPTEGTAADRTPPGRTPTSQPGQTTESGERDSQLVGAKVVSAENRPLGSVVDVVFDSTGQPDFVVISSEGNQATAVPYAAASSMMSGDRIVMDESKLQRAPRVKQGEWRSGSDTRWKNDASRYWNQG